MRDVIYKEYAHLTKNLCNNYNKIYVIDNYDFKRSTPYTIFYINKKESFEEFKELWGSVVYECEELDSYDYDDILWCFEEKARDNFDYVELGTLDIYTDKDYELEI